MWNSLLGYVTIQIVGLSPEKVLNRAWRDQIVVRSVQRLDSRRLQADIPAKDFLRLKKCLRRSGCRAHILRRHGAPFVLARLRFRKVLWIGAAVLFAAMLFADSRIWFISVEGCRTVPEALVLRTLSENGIHRGMAAEELLPGEIANIARGSDERIAWAGARREGIVLRVEIAEAEIVHQNVPDDTPCDIVAQKDGRILEVTALCGKACVRAGDVVQAGDVLIRGDITRTDAEQRVLVHAAGGVQAQVCYTAAVTLPPTEQGEVPNGNQTPYREICLAGLLLGETAVPYERYEREPERTLCCGGLFPPLQILCGTCRETVLREMPADPEKLRARAAYEAELRAMNAVKKDAKIENQAVQLHTLADGSVRAVATITAREDIGLQKSLTQYEGENHIAGMG